MKIKDAVLSILFKESYNYLIEINEMISINYHSDNFITVKYCLKVL